MSVAAVERHVTDILMKVGLSQPVSGQHRRMAAVLRHVGR